MLMATITTHGSTTSLPSSQTASDAVDPQRDDRPAASANVVHQTAGCLRAAMNARWSASETAAYSRLHDSSASAIDLPPPM